MGVVLPMRREDPGETPGGPCTSDAALVSATRRGELWAAEILFRRHAPDADCLAQRLLPGQPPAAIRRLTDDALTEALRMARAIDGLGDFSALVAALVLRRARRPLAHAHLARRIGSPAIGHRVQGGTLRRALEALRPDAHIAVVLRHVEGRSYEEIADITHCNLGTVKSRLNRARSSFAELIEPALR